MKKINPDKGLKECIQSIFDENDGNYGYRHIQLELKNSGDEVNHKKVQRIMNKLELKGDKIGRNHASTVLTKGLLELLPRTELIVVFTQMYAIKN